MKTRKEVIADLVRNIKEMEEEVEALELTCADLEEELEDQANALSGMQYDLMRAEEKLAQLEAEEDAEPESPKTEKA